MHTRLLQIAFMALMIVAWSGAARASESGPGAIFSEAEQLYRVGEYEKALASYRLLIEKFPKDWRTGQARYTEGFILQKKLKRPEQARDAYEKVITQNPASPLARNAEFQIAEVYEQSGDTKKAIDKYQDLIRKANRHPREGLAKRKIDLLDRKVKGQPAIPQGWATTIERRAWRRIEEAIADDRKNLKFPKIQRNPNRPRLKDMKVPDKPVE
jgi:tetratricopeptide (TPR) repeat protein